MATKAKASKGKAIRMIPRGVSILQMTTDDGDPHEAEDGDGNIFTAVRLEASEFNMSHDVVLNLENGDMHIGCTVHDIPHWRKVAARLAKAEGIEKDEVAALTRVADVAEKLLKKVQAKQEKIAQLRKEIEETAAASAMTFAEVAVVPEADGFGVSESDDTDEE